MKTLRSATLQVRRYPAVGVSRREYRESSVGRRVKTPSPACGGRLGWVGFPCDVTRAGNLYRSPPSCPSPARGGRNPSTGYLASPSLPGCRSVTTGASEGGSCVKTLRLAALQGRRHSAVRVSRREYRESSVGRRVKTPSPACGGRLGWGAFDRPTRASTISSRTLSRQRQGCCLHCRGNAQTAAYCGGPKP